MSNLEDWGIDGLIKKGGVMILNPKEVKKMEAKVIRSGEKNFKEEKVKMFEPKTLNKEEQLKLVFKKTIKNFLDSDFDVENYYNTQDDDIETLANNLLYEVKIRVKL